MNKYQIYWKKSAIKDLKSIPKELQPKIFSSIEVLIENPRPTNCKKLISLNNHYRIRVGNFRIIYFIEDNKLIIQIIKIGHRKEVYK